MPMLRVTMAAMSAAASEILSVDAATIETPINASASFASRAATIISMSKR